MKRKKGPIIAAGAVLLRYINEQPHVLICHSAKHDHWGLPKGKRERHEGIEECAEREILEETTYRVLTLGSFLGHTEYRSGARQKIVYWWWCEHFKETHAHLAPDVDRTAWVELSEALAKVRKKDRPPLKWISENLR